MKYLLKIIITISVFYSGSGRCDLFSLNPKNEISTRTTNTSITTLYKCKDNVDSKLLDIIFDDLVYLSKKNNINPPHKNLCTYHISEFDIFGKKMTAYQVYYNVKKSDFDNDTPDYYRNVMFKVAKNGKTVKYYNLLDNHPPYQAFNYCYTFSGQLINENEC